MASARNHPNQSYPDVPPSLNAGDFEMRDSSPDRPTYNPPANTAPYYTPYLGLRARLSQVWINRWTVLLILIIVRLLIATDTLKYDLANAKTEAMSACSSVEHVGSAMASMPHYLSDGVNSLAADGVSKAVNGLGQMLMLTLTGVQEIVTFVINLLTSTYVCLITLAVSGSLQTEIKMIEEVGDFMNQSIASITGTMSSDLNSFVGDLNSFLSKINIGGILGSKDPPKIDLSSQITALNSIHLDTDKLDADLTKLNDSIPTFDQVQNFTNNIIAFPFREVIGLVNDSLSNYTFDKSIFPVAQKQQLTFCSDTNAIAGFFDTLHHLVWTARKIFLVVLLLLAILVCIPMAYREIWRWHSMQNRALLIRDHAFDSNDVVYMSSRPMTSRAGLWLMGKVGGNTKRRVLTRWFVAYATTLPALFVLALGIAGLFSCFCQYLLLKAVEKEVPSLINKVENFADKVVSALDTASTAWATDANGVINSTNAKINDDVFGWVNTSTTAVNDTLVAFSDQMVTALNQTFGGTILYQPIMGVFNCLIELKIKGIEKGLTWVHDNAHVTLPEFNKDIFSLGAAASLSGDAGTQNFLANPGSTTGDEISSAVVKVANKLQDAITTEAIIASCLVAIWVFVVLMGLARVLYELYKRDKTRAEGGAIYNTQSGSSGGGNANLVYPMQNGSLFPGFRGPVRHSAPRYEESDGWGDVGLDGDEDAIGIAEQEKIRSGGVRSQQGVRVDEGHRRESSYGDVGDVKY